MGRKGVSKRKPKKSVSIDNNNHGSRPGESSSSVQSLVHAKDAPPNRGGNNPSDGSNKKTKKRR